MKEKRLDNCAHCEDFPCDKLKTRMNFVEEHVKDLASVSEEDYNLFIKPYLSKGRLLNIRRAIEGQGREE